MNNFMTDLETLGVTPGCVILSIGVIAFDPFAKKVEDIFADDGARIIVNKQSCLDHLLHVDESTETWWAGQGAAAKKVLDEAKTGGLLLPDALNEMVTYVSEHTNPNTALIWGNGADFDNPILNVAARHCLMSLPWKWGNRCYRTVKNLHEFLVPNFKAPPLMRTGTYHDCLDDARNQAVHMWDVLDTLRKRGI